MASLNKLMRQQQEVKEPVSAATVCRRASLTAQQKTTLRLSLLSANNRKPRLEKHCLVT